jgi:ketosteroid isomerase-like protein
MGDDMTTGTDSLTERNRAMVQEMYAAVTERADIQEFMAHVSDDVVVHEPPYLPYGGDYAGKEAFLALFGKVAAALDTRTITLESIIADGDKVMAFVRACTKPTGEIARLVEESTIRDGKVVDIRVYYFDTGCLLGVSPSSASVPTVSAERPY